MENFCLRFIRFACDAERASYRIESFDFNEEDAWEEIARLHVRLPERGYAFEPLARWEKERILFPTFYLLSSQEQDTQLRDLFGPLRMGLGAYALRVHSFAISCIESGTLPLFHPPMQAGTTLMRTAPVAPNEPVVAVPRRRAAAMNMAPTCASTSVPVRAAPPLAAAISTPQKKRPQDVAGMSIVPEPRDIDRTAALGKLQATHAQRLVQLCAPAGFGKTSLMRQYAASLRSQGVPTRWLTLGEPDNDLHRLRDLLETASAALLDDVSSHDIPLHGLRDDAHPTLFIDQVDALETIALAELCAFVEKMRDQPLRFVMAARARVVLDYLPCERWSRSVDVGAEDLAFSEAETRALVAQMFDVPPDGALAVQLHSQTQGWPAVVRLLCRQLRERDALAAGTEVDAIDGLHRQTPVLTNYLMEEVIERVPEALWPLLRDLSVIDPVQVAMGERLLGRGDVASALQALCDAGVPMRKLDSGAYALHPLLLPHLRRQACRHDPDRFATLGEQAAQWLVADGRIGSAVDSLVASGNHPAAVRLIESHAASLLGEVSATQWAHWCRQIPVDQVKASAVLCTTHATLVASRGTRALASQWLAWCEQAARMPGADARWANTAQWLRLQDLVARGTPAQVQRALPTLKAAVLDAGRGERHRLAALLAEALLATGDYAGADRNIQIAKRIAREERCVTGMAHAHFLEGVSAAVRGRMTEAQVSLKTAHLLAQSAGQKTLRTHGLYARVSGFFAALHYERNQLADAMAWAGVYEHYGAFSAQAVDSALQATLVAARIAQLQRRPRQAIALLETRLQQARAAEFPRAECILERELARHAAALHAAQQATAALQLAAASMTAASTQGPATPLTAAASQAPASLQADTTSQASASPQACATSQACAASRSATPQAAAAAQVPDATQASPVPPSPAMQVVRALPAAAGEPELPRDFCLRPGDEVHGGGLSRVRALLASDRAAEASVLLRALIATAQQHQRRWREAKLRAMLCVAHAQEGHAEQAAQECEAALAMGAEMGLMRSFLDESAFLEHVRARQVGVRRGAPKNTVAGYAAALLAAADSETTMSAHPGMVNFSEQESRVLDLIAVGQPNKQVAATLALSVNTVKWHLARIYVKLGANSRAQAVFLAKKRGFIG